MGSYCLICTGFQPGVIERFQIWMVGMVTKRANVLTVTEPYI